MAFHMLTFQRVAKSISKRACIENIVDGAHFVCVRRLCVIHGIVLKITANDEDGTKIPTDKYNHQLF